MATSPGRSTFGRCAQANMTDPRLCWRTWLHSAAAPAPSATSTPRPIPSGWCATGAGSMSGSHWRRRVHSKGSARWSGRVSEAWAADRPRRDERRPCEVCWISCPSLADFMDWTPVPKRQDWSLILSLGFAAAQGSQRMRNASRAQAPSATIGGGREAGREDIRQISSAS